MKYSELARCWPIVFVLASCQATPVNQASHDDQVMPSISISLPTPEVIKVTYRLDHAASEMRFARNPNDSRPERWQVPEQFEFVHIDDSELLRRIDGQDFKSVSVEIATRYVPLPKDYAPFSPFTDGGLLIHSGQFHACPGKDECPDNGEWQLSVDVSAPSRIILNGEIYDHSATMIDTRDGTNIYIGDEKPLESSHFVAVIDGGLPRDIRQLLYRLFPPLMDYFTERLGELDQKPALFASIDPISLPGSGFSAQGGTLPGQVFMHLYGEKWATESASRAPDQLPFFFAHEAAHLFQRTGRDNVDINNDQSWIHEGGADAFAILTMAQFAGVDKELIAARVDRAIDECIRGLVALNGRPLNASYESGSFENYYNCGLIINLVIDAELLAVSDGEHDLFDVWRIFISKVRAGDSWNQQVFLQVVDEFGAKNAVEFARTMASRSYDAELLVRSELDRWHIRLSVD